MYRECGLHRAGKKCGVRLSRDTRDGPSLSSRLCLGCGGVHDTPPHIHIVTTSSPIAHKVRLHSARGDSAHAYARNHILFDTSVFRAGTSFYAYERHYIDNQTIIDMWCACLKGVVEVPLRIGEPPAPQPRLILTPDPFVPTALPGLTLERRCEPLGRV